MKDFFGTVVEPGDAVIVARGSCYGTGWLSLTEVREVHHDSIEVNIVEGHFSSEDFISMKSIAAGKVVTND